MVTQGTNSTDWVSENLTEKDLIAYRGIEDSELDKGNIFAIFLGYYLKWDPQESKRVAMKNGFKVADEAKTGLYNFADIDDTFISIHHWLKWYKFGFSRLHDNLSIEIRNGRISREEAIRIIKDKGDTPPLSDIEEFCRFCDIRIEEFWAICEKFRNHDIWTKDDDKWVMTEYLVEGWNWS